MTEENFSMGGVDISFSAKPEQALENKKSRILSSKKSIEEKRLWSLIKFLKQKKDFAVYVALALIIWFGIYLRTLNLKINPLTGKPFLWNFATNDWAIGMEFDPFLFLRWMEYIVAHGRLMVIDTMRYAPFGYDTSKETALFPYMMAWTHKILEFLSLTDSITYSAVIFPVIMFIPTILILFLLTKKVFYKESKITQNLIALLATIFFALLPILLSKTGAGVADKESAALLFMLLSFYFFLEAFKSEKFKRGLIFGILAGISTGLMALLWGGVVFVFIPVSLSVFIYFLIGKVELKEFVIYFSWLAVSFLLMFSFSNRYSLQNITIPGSPESMLIILFILGTSFFFLKNKKTASIINRVKLPAQLTSVIISGIVLVILAVVIFGLNTIISPISFLKNFLANPATTRFGVSISENRQPYFLEDWVVYFGPIIGVPFYFYIFFFGVILLFWNMLKPLKKIHKITLTLSYFIFIWAVIFTRYSEIGVLNGTNGVSLFLYALGPIIFFGTIIYTYIKIYKEKEFFEFEGINFSYLFYIILFTFSIFAARSAIRIFLVVGAISVIPASFFTIKIFQKYFTEKEELNKFFMGLLSLALIISLLFSLYFIYQKDKKVMLEELITTKYVQQWQRAMEWVRTNTPENAVFAAWWDYGYWLQTRGRRTTILDGGNSIPYWNHLLGKYALTGNDENKALEFLYTHNATHLLIDLTDIKKYAAISAIGSNEDYDRFSQITRFNLEKEKISNFGNQTLLLYPGESQTYEDIIWNFDGKEVLFPAYLTQIKGFALIKEKEGKIVRVEIVLSAQNKDYAIPLRYVYISSENKLIDLGSGLESMFFIYPSVSREEAMVDLNIFGAALYIPKKARESNLVQLYLLGGDSEYFNLEHIESDNIIAAWREDVANDIGEFIFYENDFHGPIKIWSINYPQDIKTNPEFLKTEFPSRGLELAKL
ncbi:hypothetical protein J4225_02200 [Candidatus Pacearchaeota archaeon]|nr:hypothetical protein [Candidatus Pacearchaeota archaeon]